MTSACRCLFVVPLLVLGLLALGSAPLCGAASGAAPEVPYEQRTDAFRRLLFELRFQPLQDFIELQEKPSESLFVMLGDPRCLPKQFFQGELRSFVEQGGAVLIATDMRTEGEAGEELRKLAGVTVTGETLIEKWVGHSNPTYGESEYCPYVEPLEDSLVPKRLTNALGTMAAFAGAGGAPALFRNPHPNQPNFSVATNAPSRLKMSGWWLPWGIHRLARLPLFCRNENPNVAIGPNRASFEEDLLFAVGGTVGKGRVLVLADHSIFINRMILPRDNGNMEFAANCLHWLRGGISTPAEALSAVRSPDALQRLAGRRDKVLFWDNGAIHRDFAVPLKTVPKTPPLPSEPAIVAAIDKTIAELEASDYFNRALLEGRYDHLGPRWRVVRYAVYFLTLAAALLVGYRYLWRSRHRPELAVPLLAHALREHEPRASLLDQRRRALLRLRNLWWEMGHHLARECFASAGLALTAATPPVVKMKGSRWRRWRVQRRLGRLWHLARGDAPAPISFAALGRLQRELEQLKTALADGTIELT